jgi:hypothetical protein
MTNPTQINQGGAQNQERQPKQQTGSNKGGQKGIENEARRVVEGGEEDQQSHDQRKQRGAGAAHGESEKQGGIGGR